MKTAMTPLKLLAIEMKAFKRSKYPNVPEYALPTPKYSDKTANGLTAAICDKIKLDGYFIARINTQGNYREGLGWTKSNSTKGMSDLVACIDGKFISIEIKAGNDYQRPDQQKVEHSIQRSGGIYFIARTYSGFFEWYCRLKNKGAAL